MKMYITIQGGASHGETPPCLRLDAESADTVEQGDAQLLIQIFIKAAAVQRFPQQQRLVEVKYFRNGRFLAVFGPEHEILEINGLSPRNSFLNF